MVGGSANDVFQAVLQCFFGMNTFVTFFLSKQYLQIKKGTKSEKPMCEMLSRVFGDLLRDNFEDITAPYVDIGYFANFIKEKF